MARARLAIITALKEEQRAIETALPAADRESRGIRLLRGGVGWNSAERAASQILTEAPEDAPPWICSSGFCGGLIDNLPVGHIVISDRLMGPGPDSSAEYASAIDAALLAALRHAGVPHTLGPLATVRQPVTTSLAKRRLHTDTGAIAVDMETYAVVSAVAGHAAPETVRVFALRAVSDSVEDELPPQAGEFLDERGDVRALNVARFALGGPGNMKKLWGLKARSDKAAASLSEAWRAIFDFRLRIFD